MRIVVDENIPMRTVRALVGAGHEVLDVRGSPRQAIDDDGLWKLVQERRALLVSTDKSFARRDDDPHGGALIIRLRYPNRERIHQRVMQAIGRIRESDWPGLVVVMRDRAMSVRRVRPKRS
jgi:predicted nuclease of predicted toxin-antitoxin system